MDRWFQFASKHYKKYVQPDVIGKHTVLGAVHIWRQVVGGEGFSKIWFHTLEDTNKSSDEGEGGMSKKGKKILTSYMDGPLYQFHMFLGKITCFILVEKK